MPFSPKPAPGFRLPVHSLISSQKTARTPCRPDIRTRCMGNGMPPKKRIFLRFKVSAMMSAIFLVICDVFAALRHAFFGKDSSSALLDDIGSTVKLGGLSAVPHSMQGHLFSVGSWEDKLSRNYGVTAAGSGKACGLGQGAEFDGTFFCTFDRVDAARQLWVGDKCLVSGVEEDDSMVSQGIINPFF